MTRSSMSFSSMFVQGIYLLCSTINDTYSAMHKQRAGTNKKHVTTGSGLARIFSSLKTEIVAARRDLVLWHASFVCNWKIVFSICFVTKNCSSSVLLIITAELKIRSPTFFRLPLIFTISTVLSVLVDVAGYAFANFFLNLPGIISFKVLCCRGRADEGR